MKAEYLLDFLYDVYNEHSHIESSSVLKEASSFAGTQDDIEKSIEIIQYLSKKLTELNYQNHPIFNEVKIDNKSFFRHLGFKLATKLDDLCYEHGDNLGLYRATLNDLKNKHSESLNKISDIASAFTSVNIEPLQKPEETAQLIVSLPNIYLKPEIDDFTKHTQRISEVIKNVSFIIDGTRNDIIIEAISASRIKFFLNISLVKATVVSLIAHISLDNIIKVQTVWKNQLEINELMSDNTNTNTGEFVDNALKEIAKKCAAEITREYLDGKDDKAKETLHACNGIVKMLNDGYKLEVRVPDLKKTDETEETPEIQANNEQIKRLNQIASEVIKLEQTRPNEALLKIEGPQE